MENNKNFGYVYSQEKYDEYQKLSVEQKLEWLEKMSRFTYYFGVHTKNNAILKTTNKKFKRN